MSYCTAIASMPDSEKKELHKNYHDNHYGFPIHNDNELFGRLIMEINQAGLSWETILKKEQSLRSAYQEFNIQKIAAFTEEDVNRLLLNPGIIRNRLKINAIIDNAKRVISIQKEFGSFEKWLESHHPKSKDEWVKIFKKEFRFTGGEIVSEFLMSIGYLSGAHSEECPIYHAILAEDPMWAKNNS